MTTSLPPNPSLKHLRLEAKALLKAHKNGDASCCGVLRHLRQFRGKPDEGILEAEVRLQEVQFALAMEYGFESWTALRRHLEGRDAAETLHVTWDKPFAERIRTLGAGDTTIWQDPVVEGPAPLMTSAEEWWDIRRRFWVESGVVPRDVLEVRGIADMDKRLLRYSEYREVVIWSDSCLFDQSMLIRHLDWFSRRDMGGTRLSFVCGDECPIPVSEGSPEAIHDFMAQRQEVTAAHVELARKAWRAFRSPDPTAIEEVIAGDCSALPYLADALIRHLERFPFATNGLSRYERETLEVLSGGRLNLTEVTKRVTAMEERPFGNSLFVDGLRRMASGPSPLIEADGPEGEEMNAPAFEWEVLDHDWDVAISETGRDVLAGRKDFIGIQGIDRWIGGVHLQGDESAWRWNGGTNSLARTGLSSTHVGGSTAAAFPGEGVPPRRDTPAKASLKREAPSGRADTIDYVQGLSMMLSYVGHPVDYHTVMGDVGQAFIFQAETHSTNTIDGAVDVGWWPLHPWGQEIRRAFLGQTVGRQIHSVPFDRDEFRADEALYCLKHFMPIIRESIAADLPVLARENSWVLVTGYDDGKPPLLGYCARTVGNEAGRLGRYPWLLTYLGNETSAIPRQQADVEAVKYAIALARDTAPTQGGWSSGLKSFEAWIKALEDTERLGQARWHANVCLHFRLNRTSAVEYLHSVADRNPQASGALLAAAGRYGEVLHLVSKADTSNEAMMSAEGRQTLIQLARKIRDAEERAVTEMEDALAAME